MIKVIVFDLGGTIMEYIGMPYSWEEFYNQGFEEINKFYQCGVSAACIDKSIEILKSYNAKCSFVRIDRKQKGIGDICDLTEIGRI